MSSWETSYSISHFKDMDFRAIKNLLPWNFFINKTMDPFVALLPLMKGQIILKEVIDLQHDIWWKSISKENEHWCVPGRRRKITHQCVLVGHPVEITRARRNQVFCVPFYTAVGVILGVWRILCPQCLGKTCNSLHIHAQVSYHSWYSVQGGKERKTLIPTLFSSFFPDLGR